MGMGDDLRSVTPRGGRIRLRIASYAQNFTRKDLLRHKKERFWAPLSEKTYYAQCLVNNVGENRKIAAIRPKRACG
jgi:hypothetical protein